MHTLISSNLMVVWTKSSRTSLNQVLKIWLSAVHHLHGALKCLQIQNTLFTCGLMRFLTTLRHLVMVKKNTQTLIISGTREQFSIWLVKISYVSTQFTGQLCSWCWTWNCLTAWLPTVGLLWKTVKCLNLKVMWFTQKCLSNAMDLTHFVITSCAHFQLVLTEHLRQKITLDVSIMSWQMTLETFLTAQLPWLINISVAMFQLTLKMSQHLMLIWQVLSKKNLLNTINKWMLLTTHVHLMRFGALFHVQINTLMKQLLGFLQKMTLNVMNWQQ